MNDMHLDPEAVRGFGDDVWTELETNIRPWIREIVAELGGPVAKGPHGNGFGNRNVAYAAPRLDEAHGSGASELKRWLADLGTGVEALALGSAVTAEQLASTDIKSALWIDKSGALRDRGTAA